MVTITLNIPKDDTAFLKKLIKKMGWTMKEVAPNDENSCLQDPQTGNFLNRETIETIEKTEQGEGLIECNDFEDFIQKTENI